MDSSKAKTYKHIEILQKKHQFLLGLFYTSQLLFWILSILLLVFRYDWKWIISLITLRLAIQLLSFGLTAKKLDDINLVFFAPFLELFLITTQLFIFIANLVGTPKHWK